MKKYLWGDEGEESSEEMQEEIIPEVDETLNCGQESF